uniref:Uncharacterized protein n=1 Tax=Panagrellus redivivus TaxID=6233 RepID=A0A7E4UZ14_PANRE
MIRVKVKLHPIMFDDSNLAGVILYTFVNPCKCNLRGITKLSHFTAGATADSRRANPILPEERGAIPGSIALTSSVRASPEKPVTKRSSGESRTTAGWKHIPAKADAYQ